ncbi:MAG: hypothetical protein GQ544_08685 [Candidatus Aminicenantes bacterium]|nr:hypothetical protein [Candidatus Aminicenantes bacterium]
MPRGNRTGPLGQGPRTGRAMGYCSGYPTPGFTQGGLGMGFGRGQAYRHGFAPGNRMGWGYNPWQYSPYSPAPSQEEELEVLKNQAEILAQQQNEIKQRITDLEKSE